MSNPLTLNDWQGVNYGQVGFSVGLRPDRLEIQFVDGRYVALELEDHKIRVHAFTVDIDEPASINIPPPKKQMMIEVFPMNIDGGIADIFEDVTHYDILYRPDGGDPELEYENLTLHQAEVLVQMMMKFYPEAVEDWSCVELLR